MMSTLTLSEIAFAISTDCCAASVNPLDVARTSIFTPKFSKIIFASLYI